MKELATKPYDVSSISKTHMIEGENNPHELSSDLHVNTVRNTHTH